MESHCVFGRVWEVATNENIMLHLSSAIFFLKDFHM